MQPISPEEARSYGMETKHDRMDNGELRFRLNCSADGSSYCRTVAPESGAWQNSHYHKGVSELYVVQSGWIAYAELNEGKFKLELLRPGESVTFRPLVHHNLYLSPGSVIHTIKYGIAYENDWFPSPELNERTKHLALEALFATEPAAR